MKHRYWNAVRFTSLQEKLAARFFSFFVSLIRLIFMVANLEDIFYDQLHKRAAFDKLDELSNHPSDQARKLITLFYAQDQATHAAE